MSFELNIRLSPQEVIQRITGRSDEMSVKSNKDAWMFLIRGYGGDRPFQYQINGNSIFIRPRPRMRNFQHGMNLHIEQMSYGSKLTGRMALNPQTKSFMKLWLGVIGFVTILTIYFIVKEIRVGEKPLNEMLWILFPIGMMVAAYIMIFVSRLLSKNEMQEISDWLNRLLADSVVESQTLGEA